MMGVGSFTKQVLAVVVFSLLVPAQVFSCPAYLNRDSFTPDLPSQARNTFALFTWSGSEWTQHPLQIDPANRDARLLFFDDGEQFQDWELSAKDRISFLMDRFDKRVGSSVTPPCKTDFIYEIKDTNGKYVYLAACDKDMTSGFVVEHPIVHDKDQLTVKAKFYDYKYHEQNHMMFDDILVRPPGVEPFSAGGDSIQRIRADVKRFFTLNFTNDDVESKLIRTRGGPLALLGQLTFFLRILFFKIDLQLQTVVSFFEDSVHMPLTINMPVDTSKRTNPGTGMIFSWQVPEGVVWDQKLSTMPVANAEVIKKGFKALGKTGLKNCRGSSCFFSLVGTLKGFQWSTEFKIPRRLVQSGFFPMFMADTSKTLVDVGWDKEGQYGENQVGIYYETSGLTKGQHDFDFWIKIGSKNKSVERDCPHPVSATRRIAVSDEVRAMLARGLEDDIFSGQSESDVPSGLHIIRSQAQWQEWMDSLEYDIDPQLLSRNINFERMILVAYVDEEHVRTIASTTSSKKQLQLNLSDRGPAVKDGHKSLHFVVLKKIRKKIILKK
jgi:hypothetical protein